MAIAALVLVGTIDVKLHGTTFALSLVFFGIGAGLLMSQLGNVIMSSASGSHGACPESARKPPSRLRATVRTRYREVMG